MLYNIVYTYDMCNVVINLQVRQMILLITHRDEGVHKNNKFLHIRFYKPICFTFDLLIRLYKLLITKVTHMVNHPVRWWSIWQDSLDISLIHCKSLMNLYVMVDKILSNTNNGIVSKQLLFVSSSRKNLANSPQIDFFIQT